MSNTRSIFASRNCDRANTIAYETGKYDHGGYTDWFIPSILELKEIYDVVGPGATSPIPNTANFGAIRYWSSTEASDQDAWMMDFSNGNMYRTPKLNRGPTLGKVRPIRSASINPNDTTRSFEGDISLVNAVCSCGGAFPPFMVRSSLSHGYSVSNLVEAGVSLSSLLNSGVSVAMVLEAGVLPEELYGLEHTGGIIFSINEDTGGGLVAAMTDQGQAYWACGLPGEPQISPCVVARHLAEGHDGGGYNDWYLPSIEELQTAYDHIGLGSTENSNSGLFLSDFYWSVTASSGSNATAKVIHFGMSNPTTGNILDVPILTLYSVRAIRAF